MSVELIDPLKTEDCLKKVEEKIIYNRTCARCYELVRPVFVKHDGKKMTKRMETDFIKALDQAQIDHERMWCRFDRQCGMFHFKIGGTFLGQDFNNRISFSVHLGYESQSDIMSVLWADEHNIFYSKNAVPEAAEWEKNKGLVKKLVDNWNIALEMMKNISKDAEAVGLQYTFNVKQ